MPEVIISDSRCLIALTNARHLYLPQKVYGRIMTTSVVVQEYGMHIPDWIEVKDPIDERLVGRFMDLVDAGEASAIALAVETDRSVVILDHLAARRLVTDLELPHTGMLDILLKAKSKGDITAVAPILNDIKRVSFRLSSEVEEKVLRLAGEL